MPAKKKAAKKVAKKVVAKAVQVTKAFQQKGFKKPNGFKNPLTK